MTMALSNRSETPQKRIIAELKSCLKGKDLYKGGLIHADILKRKFLENDIYIGSALVNMYAKCGALPKAQEVFDNLPVHNVVSWNALISGYTQNGFDKIGLLCFEHMQLEGVTPDCVTYACILKACGKELESVRGREIHVEVSRLGLLHKNILVGNALVDMYAKSGSIAISHEVFKGLTLRDLISWNVLMTGYAQHGYGEDVLKCFEQMQDQGLSPDAITLVCVLKACGDTNSIHNGIQVHLEIARKSLIQGNVSVGNALVDMYAKCGAFLKARDVFDELPMQTIVAWNALISGYAEHGHEDDSLIHFVQMQQEGMCPDAVTFICILKACANMEDIRKGKHIHSEIVTQGLLENNISLGNALIDMYGKHGTLKEAQAVFDALTTRNVVSWTGLIAGYAQHGHDQEALICFERMKGDGFSPNELTYVCVLKACGNMGAIDKGKEIHRQIERERLLEKNVLVGNALVAMYAKCGKLTEAQNIFDELPMCDTGSWNALIVGYSKCGALEKAQSLFDTFSDRDVISWTALITGFAQHGYPEEALKYYELMKYNGFSPNAVTFLCIVNACGSIGAADKGTEIHNEIIRDRMLAKDTTIGNALVDMYAKCGDIKEAHEVFNELPVHNIVPWNALIAGYAQLGKDENVCNLFEEMVSNGVWPNAITFVLVLSAFRHSGLLAKGRLCFKSMTTFYGIIPSLEHYSCMVDLFSRAGHFEDAVTIIENMPSSNCFLMWTSLIGSCQKWGNLEFGKWAFDHIIHLDKNDHSSYVCMSNIYAAAAMHAKLDNIE